MKTRHELNFVWLAVLAIMLSSCSGRKDEMASYVPQNAVTVVRFNMANLYTDGKFKEFSDSQTFKQICDLSGLMLPELPQILRKVGENSDATGMDLKSEAYLSVTKTSATFILPMKDKNNFLKFAKSTVSSAQSVEPKKIGKFLSVTINNGSVLVAWNSDVIFFLGLTGDESSPQALEKEFTSITSLDADKSITSLTIYKDITNPEKDIVMLFNDETSKAITEQMNLGSMSLFGSGFKYLVALNFDMDRITCDMKTVFGNDSDATIFAKLGHNGVDARLLDFLPDTSFAAFTQGYNIAACTEFIAKLKGSALKDGKPEDDKRKILNAVFTMLDKHIRDLTGDFVIGVPTIAINDETGEPEPVVVGVFATNNNNILAGVMNDLTIAGKGISDLSVEKTGNKYKVKIPEFGNCYFAEKDKAVTVSSNVAYLDVMLAGKFPQTLSSSAYASNLKNGFGYVRLNPENMPENLRNFIQNDPFYSSLLKVLNAFNDMTVKFDYANYTGVMTLNFQKSGKNSLFKLINMIDKSLNNTDISMR